MRLGAAECRTAQPKQYLIRVGEENADGLGGHDDDDLMDLMCETTSAYLLAGNPVLIFGCDLE